MSGEATICLDTLEDGSSRTYTESLVPIVNQEAVLILEILTARTDEKSVCCHVTVDVLLVLVYWHCHPCKAHHMEIDRKESAVYIELACLAGVSLLVSE